MILDKFINWMDYWFVPVGSTDKQRADRLFELGMGVGFILTFIVIISSWIFS